MDMNKFAVKWYDYHTPYLRERVKFQFDAILKKNQSALNPERLNRRLLIGIQFKISDYFQWKQLVDESWRHISRSSPYQNKEKYRVSILHIESLANHLSCIFFPLIFGFSMWEREIAIFNHMPNLSFHGDGKQNEKIHN